MARSNPGNRHWLVPVNRRFHFLREYLYAGKYIVDFDSINRRRRFDFLKRNNLPVAATQNCYLNCGHKGTTWHHIVPIIKGGDDSERNLVPLCSACHKRVHRRSITRPNRQKETFINPFVKPVNEVVYVAPARFVEAL